VAYRHAILTAYVTVRGSSEAEASREAGIVRLSLSERLPEADVRPPRYKGEDKTLGHIFEVPAIIFKCPKSAKSILARVVLQGHV